MLVLLALFAASVLANEVDVAQTAAAQGPSTDCPDAKSVFHFLTSGNRTSDGASAIETGPGASRKTRPFIPTYYISPTGSDANTGAQSSPFATFTKVMSMLSANCPGAHGCTVFLLDGKYQPATGTGLLNINCGRGGNAPKGTAHAPITLEAWHERQAFLEGDGTAEPFKMTNCTYWNIVGLHAESGDFLNEPPQGNPGTGGNVFEIVGSTNLRFIRNIGARNNRYKNSHIFAFEYASSKNIICENEAYDFHRSAFLLFGASNNNEVCLNYANSRGYGNISGGYDNGGLSFAFHVYGSDSNLVESNIAEGSATVGFNSEDNAGHGSTLNQWLGDVALNLAYGVRSADHAGFNALASEPNNESYVNLAVVNPSSVGFYVRTSYSMSCTNCSVFGTSSTVGGFILDAERGNGGAGVYTGHRVSQSLSINSTTGYGFQVDETNGGNWSGSFHGVLAFNNAINFASANFSVSGRQTINPQMGTCYLWTPESSAIAGQGIGATIVYQYSKGALTAIQLWTPSGQFAFQGATVAQLNDRAGQSLYDVGTRLNVNQNGCSFPTGSTKSQSHP